MNEEEVKAMVSIREFLIKSFNRCKDFKQNKNAIMREMDHAEVLHKTIVDLDRILKKYVDFS